MRTAARSSIALIVATVVAGCAGNPNKGTLGSLHQVAPDTREAQVDNGLDRAVQGYQRFLAETPHSQLTPEAMRRLADLEVEKEYGLLGGGKLVEVAASAGSAVAKPTAGSVPMPAPAATRKIDARSAGPDVLRRPG